MRPSAIMEASWAAYALCVVLGLKSVRPAFRKGRWTWSVGEKEQTGTRRTNWNPHQSPSASKPLLQWWGWPAGTFHPRAAPESGPGFRATRKKIQPEVKWTVGLACLKPTSGPHDQWCEWTAMAPAPNILHLSVNTSLPPFHLHTFLWVLP